MKNTTVEVVLTKVAANTLFSIYQDISGFVESNKGYQDVSKAESDANAIKGILDQIDTSVLDYESGH